MTKMGISVPPMIFDIEDVNKIISKNYKEYSTFHFPLTYQILYTWKNSLGKDLDTNLILSNLLIKALKNYNHNNKTYSYKDFIKNKELNIGKYKKAEISRELKIPRETVRRKLEDLQEIKLITMVDGTIKVNRKSFEISDLQSILNKYTKCLNIILDNLVNQNITKKKKITEEHLLDNFSQTWINLLSMMIELSIIWRNFLTLKIFTQMKLKIFF